MFPCDIWLLELSGSGLILIRRMPTIYGTEAVCDTPIGQQPARLDE